MKNSKVMYVLVLIVCTLLSVMLIGTVSVKTANNILEENAEERLILIRDKTKMNFNAAINSIEQSVNTLSSAAVNHLDDKDAFKTDPEYVDSYTESLVDIMLYSAKNTTGAMSVYIRYNPDMAYPTSGTFFVKNSTTGEFESEPPTDFSLYVNDTTGRTEWYSIPVSRGKPTWLEPYNNENISFTMVSYVVPIIIDGETYGVIGMDIDYEYLCDMARNTEVYDTGYVCLLNREGQVIYHPEYELYSNYTMVEELSGFNEILASDDGFGCYDYKGEKTVACTDLDIGMILCVTAPNSEIYKDAGTLQKQLLFIAFVVLIVLSMVSVFVVMQLVKASETDGLTGILNRRGFMNRFEKTDSSELEKYTLFIFDIDFFKQVNDKYGHNSGDAAIQFAAEKAVEVLGKSSICARWGGDEFIGLIRSEHAHKRLEALRKAIAENDSDIFGKITISTGAVPVKGEKDLIKVTEAADKALYTVKNRGRNDMFFGE
ncbi:MAG: diguanylate cyclase [Oscillospiraceae bacterium]|nr:diguanylate cyclase [Oscillospiraceae bacterium]